MSVTFREKLRPYKRMVQHWLAGSPLDFDKETLPWIDREDADIDSFLKTFEVPQGYKYDLKEKLNFWKDNGYVILEGAIPAEWCDKLWEEVEYTIDNNHLFDMTALIYQVNNTKDIALKKAPKEKLGAIGARINDYHQTSVACKKVLSNSNIATFLKAIFNEPVVAFQSLIFKYSSQQGAHQDFPWVTSGIASHLAASWIALEDVDPDSGPLFYFPGSHKIKKFNFGNGILFKSGESLRTPQDFENYLETKYASLGIKKETLILKKGDLLIWHSALAHGGLRVNGTPPKTRKSLVVHYSTRTAYPTAMRYGSHEKPEVAEINGIATYKHPHRPDEEDMLKMGESWT